MRQCPSKRVMIVTEDGGYESTSDYDEETFVLLQVKNMVEMILNMRRTTWLLKMLTGMNV